MRKNIVLTGFMGSGKSSVGKHLAQKVSYRLLDTDRMIEKKAGRSISKIMEEEGEPAFRKMEQELLRELANCPEHNVISTGGGLPIAEGNADLLKKAGFVVYLRTRPETVLKRLAGDTTRPLLNGPDKEEKVRKLMEYREPIYSYGCHLTIDTDGRGLMEICEEIIRNYGYFQKKTGGRK